MSLTRIIIISFVLIPLFIYSQLEKRERPTIKIFSEKTSNLGLNALKIVDELNFNQTFKARSSNNLNESVSLIIKLKEDCTFNFESSFFKHVLPLERDWFSVSIDLNDIEKIKLIDCILYADIGKTKINENQSTNLLNEVSVDQIHDGIELGKSLFGEGVIIGIIDEGFDFAHPNFKDENENLRISRFWDMRGTDGNPPFFNGAENIGSEYVGEEAILKKGFDKINHSHGTMVAGIAGGINGVAPKSELILVNALTTSEIIKAVQYLIFHSQAVGRPLVINMSLGFGYGITELDKIIKDQNWGSTPGLVIVKSAGNNGDEYYDHVKLDFKNTNANSKYLLVSSNNDLDIGQLGSEIYFLSENNGYGSEFQVLAGIYDMSNDEWDSDFLELNFNGNLINQVYEIIDDDAFFDSDIFKLEVYSKKNEATNRIEAKMRIIDTDNDNVDDKLVIIVNSNDEVIHAWTKPNKMYPDNFITIDSYNFETGDNNYTVTSPGSSIDLITVGSYNLTEPTIGEKSNFSSIGPTVDEYIKPDISAPGNKILSSVNRFDSYYNYSEYEEDFGTSFAAPVVTGIVALWLEQDPTLSTNDIKEILALYSAQDNFTGTAYQNNYYGHGKVNALNWLKTLNFKKKKHEVFKIYPNPTNSEVYLEPYGNYNINVFSLNGEEILISNGNQINLSQLPPSIYFIHATNHRGDVYIRKVVKF